MKKFLLLTVYFLLLCQLIFAQSKVLKNILGNWKGRAKDQTNVSLNFLDDSAVIFSLNDEAVKFNYKLNYNNSPIWFDLIGINDKISLEGIIEFPDENTLKW